MQPMNLPTEKCLHDAWKMKNCICLQLSAFNVQSIYILVLGVILHIDLVVCLSVRQVKSPAVTERCMLSETLAWQKEKSTLQAALRKAEAELSKVTASNENRPTNDFSNNKVI